jgi:hypothetical protein
MNLLPDKLEKMTIEKWIKSIEKVLENKPTDVEINIEDWAGNSEAQRLLYSLRFHLGGSIQSLRNFKEYLEENKDES